jgi:hydrogenase-1 operon protein HyaF
MARVTRLHEIPIAIELPGMGLTGNGDALLREIATQLDKLLATGETGMIDLRGLPLSPADYDYLREMLGQGEMAAQLHAIGPTEIVETRYPGVWWITHRNVDDSIVAEVIEVTFLPEIMKSQTEDVREGLARLHQTLDTHD